MHRCTGSFVLAICLAFVQAQATLGQGETDIIRRPATRATLEKVFPAMPLAEAVEKLKLKAAINSVGREEPPLTLDEVEAAIRGWSWRDDKYASKEVFSAFEDVVESGQLPAGGFLDFTTQWEVGDAKFKVWWIDLTIPLEKDKTGYEGYTFRIRDRKISVIQR